MSDRLFTPRFISLWLFQFVVFFSAFQLLPAIPLRILELGGSKAAAGAFLFVYTFASAMAAPITGTIADQIGRRRMLLLASALFIVFSLAYGVITNLPLLLAVGLIHGALWSGILSSASAIMAGFIPPSRRTQGLAYWGLAPTAAISIAPMIGLAVHQFGWLTLCLELAALSIVMTIWASKLPVVEETVTAQIPDLRQAWDWRVVGAASSQTVAAFGYGGITSYAAILAHERGITPESLYFSVFAITVVLVRVFTGHLGDRFGAKVMILPGYVGFPIAYLVLAFASTRAEMILSAAIFGLSMGVSFPSFMTFVLTHTDERHRARTIGSLILAFDTGIGVGSLLIGQMGQRWGLTRAFLVATVVACFSIPIFLVASKRLSRGTEVAPESGHA